MRIPKYRQLLRRKKSDLIFLATDIALTTKKFRPDDSASKYELVDFIRQNWIDFSETQEKERKK